MSMATTRTAAIWLDAHEVTLREMTDDQLVLWLRLQLEAALVRLSCRAVTEEGLDAEVREALEASGMLEDFRQNLTLLTPSRDALTQALDALVHADDACVAMALVHAGELSEAEAPAVVVHLGQDKRRLVIDAQSRVNNTVELTGALDLHRLIRERLLAGT